MKRRSLQEPTALILCAVADQPRHGYAITQEVKEISDGRVTLRTGTLYSALQRLLEDGQIEVHSEETVSGRARRTYTLTPEGRATLTAEAERLRATAVEAERRLAAHRHGPKGAVA
ncbi:PadR family transcriptional regulator [Streptomyces chrestomyceticus]|uniref:PadR family transcriptional regulator n=1 Tax=Streptomyces chrestomyceticus TaxID=68185 RepID=UPI0033EB74AA